jgi:hypothetical protein
MVIEEIGVLCAVVVFLLFQDPAYLP